MAVSQETRQRMSSAHRSRHLTIKQERFIKAYAHLGNGCQAGAREAGYSASSQDVLSQQAKENLQKPHIQAALKRELARVELEISPVRVQRRLDENQSRGAGGGSVWSGGSL